jgi:hypothetical protein
MVDLLVTKLETAGAQGKILTKSAPLVRRDNLDGGNAPGFPGKRSSTSVIRSDLSHQRSQASPCSLNVASPIAASMSGWTAAKNGSDHLGGAP